MAKFFKAVLCVAFIGLAGSAFAQAPSGQPRRMPSLHESDSGWGILCVGGDAIELDATCYLSRNEIEVRSPSGALERTGISISWQNSSRHAVLIDHIPWAVEVGIRADDTPGIRSRDLGPPDPRGRSFIYSESRSRLIMQMIEGASTMLMRFRGRPAPQGRDTPEAWVELPAAPAMRLLTCGNLFIQLVQRGRLPNQERPYDCAGVAARQ